MVASVESERSSLSILLVEDRADTAGKLSRLLQVQNYEVTIAHDFASARGEALKGEYDLIICDLCLPDGNGWDLMREVLSERQIPGIAITGLDTPGDVERSREAGFSMHLPKPIDFDQLKAAIKRITS